MKRLFLLSLLALAPVVTLAQTKAKVPETAPQISIDPAAKALLDETTATYKGLNSLSYEVVTSTGGKDVDHSSASFQRPNLLRAQTQRGSTLLYVVNDGSNLYRVIGTSYSKSPSGADNAVDVDNALSPLGIAGTAGDVLGQMLGGKNPVEFFQNLYSHGEFDHFKSTTVALPPQLVDGEMLRGVRSNFSYQFSLNANQHAADSREMTFWFAGPQALLRRVDGRGPGEPLWSQKIRAQHFNPTFAPGTFQFDTTGLKQNQPF